MEGKQLHSMTGYGRESVSSDHCRVTAEVRSVNGRYLELRVKLPRALAYLEPRVRELAEKQLTRGVIDINVALHPLAAAAAALVDEDLAVAYAGRIERLGQRLGMPSGLTANAVVKLPGVITGELMPEALGAETDQLVLEAVGGALAGLVKMRRAEGSKLAEALGRELAELREHESWIRTEREQLNERYAKKLRARLEDVVGRTEGTVDQNRLYQEVAFYLDRSDVTEELDRLGSHLKQCEDLLRGGTGKSAGKRLEFLVQELMREVNTVGAKSDQAPVSTRVVEMKLALEKVREQAQNLE